MRHLLATLIGTLLLAVPCWAAVDFDGSDDCLNDSTPVNMPTGAPLSIGCWINSNTSSAVRMVIDHSERNGGDTGWTFLILGSDAIRFTTRSVKDYTSSISIAEGEWVFVGASFDTGYDVDFYYYRPSDGTESTDQVLGVADFNTDAAQRFRIGASEHNEAGDACALGSGDLSMDGQIGDCWIIDALVSAADFERIYKSGTRHVPLQIGGSSTSRYYPLNDYSGGDSVDGNTFRDYASDDTELTGDDGVGNTGLTASSEERIVEP